MEKYLKYIKNEIDKFSEPMIRNICMTEICKYIYLWEKYSTDCSLNPLYDCNPFSYSEIRYEKHDFNFHTGEKITIHWDIDKLYQIAMSTPTLKYNMSLNDFENLLQSDLCVSLQELREIEQKVQSLCSHKYDPILVVNYKPIKCYILLDGRHRYIEYKKFKQNELLPVYILDDELCFQSIINKKELLSYCIMHNIKVMNDVMIGNTDFQKMINIDKIF